MDDEERRSLDARLDAAGRSDVMDPDLLEAMRAFGGVRGA
jgi:hypothetical protein